MVTSFLRILFGRKKRRRTSRHSHVADRTYTGVDLDFNAIPSFEWSLDFCLGDQLVAETHSPSPLALLALADEVRLEHGCLEPPASMRLRHLSSGEHTALAPDNTAVEPDDVVRRVRPSYTPRPIDDTATRTTLTNPEGEAVALGEVMARLREAGEKPWPDRRA